MCELFIMVVVSYAKYHMKVCIISVLYLRMKTFKVKQLTLAVDINKLGQGTVNV